MLLQVTMESDASWIMTSAPLLLVKTAVSVKTYRTTLPVTAILDTGDVTAVQR